jgi:hypothetical protein
MENNIGRDLQHPIEHSAVRINESTNGLFSENVYANLPQLLKDCCEPFMGDLHDRDVVLMSSLITLSACFPNVSGIYNEDQCFSNLYGIILGPPASGKGYAKFAIQLANRFHEYLLCGLRDEHGIIDMAKIETNNGMKEGKNADEKESRTKRFYISANSSTAALFEDLRKSGDTGCLMFDSEIDIASSITKQDWGKMFSEVLRKCFHHERLSSSRKMDGYFDIVNPKLSVLLTGTSNQLPGFIRSIGDGLFSRFLFYKVETEPIWKDVSYKGGITLKDHFAKLSDKVFEMILYYLKMDFEFNLSATQFSEFNEKFGAELRRINSEYGEEAQSIVKRMGFITFKISMILTVLRSFGIDSGNKKLICSDVDFRLAIEFYSTFIQHSLSIFKELQAPWFKRESEKKENFYQALPDEFKRKQAIEIGKELGISERTADDILRKWIGKRLNYPDIGHYQKVRA